MKAQRELQAAIASEQAHQAAVEKQIAVLTVQLNQVAKMAKSAYRLASANQSAILNLQSDLEKAKAEFGDELAALEGRVNQKIKNVKRYAEELVGDLTVDVQQQFVEINTNLGEIEQRTQGTHDTINQIFAGQLTAVQLAQLTAAIKPGISNVTAKLNEFYHARAGAEKSFIDAIDPIFKANGVDIDGLDSSFGALAMTAQCNGSTGDAENFAQIQGREFFFHLARDYISYLYHGVRAGQNEVDSIFFGFPAVGFPDSIYAMLIIDGVSPYAANAGGDCLADSSSWSKTHLLGSSNAAKAVRQALKASPLLGQSVSQMNSKAMALKIAADQLTKNIVDQLRLIMGGEGNVTKWFFHDDLQESTPAARLSQILAEKSAQEAALAEIKVNRERFIDLARDLAKAKKDFGNQGMAMTQFQADLDQLDNAVAELANSVKSFQDDVNTLKESQIQSFSIVAAIAARLGYDDLVTAAKEEAGKIGGDVDESLAAMPATCMAAQHFYNHSTNAALATSRCESNLSTPANPLDYYSMTRCAIHGNYGTGSGSFTWGNYHHVANGWHARHCCRWAANQ